MNKKEFEKILINNPKASLDKLLKLTKNKYSRDTTRKKRVQLGLPPYKVNAQNRQSVIERELEQSGLEPNNWNGAWVKNESVSIFIKNNKGLMTYDDIRGELIKDMVKYAPNYPKIKRESIKDPHLMVVAPADPHIGKLAMSEETGEDYNVKIAVDRCIEGVHGLLQKAQGFPLDKIVLVMGNDMLHTDNTKGTTTKGTVLDTDTLWWNTFNIAKDMYIKIIEHLLTIADVEVVYCPSNHDVMSGYMLTDTVASWFHNNKNITFNRSTAHRKYVVYGLNLIELDHGDGSKEKDAHNLMALEMKEAWAKTEFHYSYKAHKHHNMKVKWHDGEDYIGISVEYFRSSSSADGWHHRNGYLAPKAIEAFIHHPERGQIARLTHYF